MFLVSSISIVTPYGDIDLGQHWLRQWIVAWRNQAITWTNADLSLVRSSDNHLRAILQEMHQPLITIINLKINCQWGANELSAGKSNFKHIVAIYGCGTSCEIALRGCHYVHFIDDKSTLVQAGYHQATGHYPSQCWHNSMSPYGVTRPQWVLMLYGTLYWCITSSAHFCLHALLI